MKLKAMMVGLTLAALTLPAFAQAPAGAPPTPPQRIRGTIVKLDGQTLTIKPREKTTLTVMLAPNYIVRTLAKKKLSDIKPGDFVGSTSMPGKDGKLHAVEVHYFPATVQIPDSQFPWDLAPGSIMTNAHVVGAAKGTHGTTLSVDYKNGTAEVIVGPKTPIVAPAPGTPADLKRGKAVYLQATKGADGMLTAGNVTVEKNGVKPPM